MCKLSHVIRLEMGIHARPAGLLVRQASAFLCDIKIINRNTGEEADLKRIMAVMALGVKKGDRIEIVAKGEDETEAITALEALLKESF